MLGHPVRGKSIRIQQVHDRHPSIARRTDWNGGRWRSTGANGRPPQATFEWDKENRQKCLGGRSVLDALPNPIDRAGVLESFKLVRAVLRARRIRCQLPLGLRQGRLPPYRAARVIRLNTDPETGKDFAAYFHTLAKTAMSDGGNAAFQHVVERRNTTKILRSMGADFATKFISFATGVPPCGYHPDHGQHCLGMVRDPLQGDRLLWLTRHGSGRYPPVIRCVAEWAEDLSIEPEQVEQLIFWAELHPEQLSMTQLNAGFVALDQGGPAGCDPINRIKEVII